MHKSRQKPKTVAIGIRKHGDNDSSEFERERRDADKTPKNRKRCDDDSSGSEREWHNSNDAP